MKRILLVALAIAACAFSSGQGTATIVSTGIAVQLSTATPPIKATGCTITANSVNAATIYVGFNSSVTSSNGTPLTAGSNYACMPVGNTAFWSIGEFWVTGTSGDGVRYTWK